MYWVPTGSTFSLPVGTKEAFRSSGRAICGTLPGTHRSSRCGLSRRGLEVNRGMASAGIRVAPGFRVILLSRAFQGVSRRGSSPLGWASSAFPLRRNSLGINMNRLLWTLLSVCIGVLSARAWLGDATRSQDTAVRMKHEGKVAANQLEATRTELAALRTEVQNKKRRIEEASLYPTISPQLLALIEGGLSGGTPAAWAELRQQL